jgi:NADH:ubiquinone oxidoreductase subunit
VEAAEDWKSKVHHIMDEQPPSNQFNADEIGLFYQHNPRNSLIQKREKGKSGKISVARLSVIFCSAATGKD